ncbi:neuronal acetylcholine receptor subunit alpha-10-like isoform X2 [Acropora muricata]
MQNLIQEILKENNKAFLPRLNETQPVEVLFDFELITIREVNAKDQTISVYGWIRQRWNNPLLQWNASEYGGIDSIQTTANSVWVPDILIYNNVDVQDRVGGGPTTYKTNVVIRSNGDNEWSSPALFKTVCAIDVRYFPFDMQTCALKFGSWASSTRELTTKPGDSICKSNHYVDNGEWDLVHVTKTRNVDGYRYDAFDDVTITIVVQRQYFTFFVNLIVPCFLISSMMFLGFILPPECGERIGLSITVLLAMTVFQQLTANIFPSFDFPLLAQYYFATSVEISLSLIATTIVLNFTARTKKKIPQWLRTLLLKWIARVVFLKKTVERSHPKPRKRKRSLRQRRARSKRKNQENDETGAAQNGNIRQITADEFASENDRRQDDQLVEQLKSTTNRTLDLDLGVLRYVQPANSFEFNRDGQGNSMHGYPATREIWFEENLPFTGVHDENGEELEEDELALRQWEWVMAARVLDRALLLLSIVMGIATFFAIFARAPRLQKLLFGESHVHTHPFQCKG